ncbi:inositol 2-dehydrogenase [Ralstonia solanacearum]|uniref:Inositol 2-dehydrogenase n=1 Tax=Ralstonia solanacearum TaxID=305 RepID=A0AAW5ZN12_RALSL|nr:inositol 2-dehydrogenase [Ralstonia solanacearum]MDB0570959.1 inositol 2-dehydrogenase [Ralstonia solanacearum]
MYQVALLGAGRIGKVHAASLVRLGRAQLRYVADVDARAAAELAASTGARVAQIDAILADPAVDAVLICTSTDTHADLIERAVRQGKAVFCEKPVDLSLERARACAHEVAASGRPCMIGFNRRFDPTFAALKRRLQDGEIGNPETLVITSRDPAPPPVSYIDRSGGIFRDMLIHDFDMFRFLLDDEAASVVATGSCLVDPAIGRAGDIDTAAVLIRTRRGRLCVINASRRAVYGYDQRIEVLGSTGMLQADNPPPTQVRASTVAGVTGDKPPYFFLERYAEAYRLELARFFEALDTQRAPAPGVDDGVRALELAEAAARSWREGRVVELDEAVETVQASALAL